MPDISELIGHIKKAAVDAVSATKPAVVMFGKVISVSPLQINIEQKMTLEKPQLILTRNVTDYKIDMTVDHWTEEEMAHRHAYEGRKRFTVHNGLAMGDEVILIQLQGGQKFLVLDRLG